MPVDDVGAVIFRGVRCRAHVHLPRLELPCRRDVLLGDIDGCGVADFAQRRDDRGF
jgi:hypothetical protein